MPNNELLLRVEHVKYRSPTASRSPIGTFHVYEDRVEWIDNASDDKLVISFNDIRGIRIFQFIAQTNVRIFFSAADELFSRSLF